jgi:Uri superfamily endonuclease
MDKGIYVLLFENPACMLRIGALGTVTFEADSDMYVGSALGSGGLARLDRHVALARNMDRRPKWHVDYLSKSPLFGLRYTVHALTWERLECRLAVALGGKNIPRFGSGDCDCRSHLLYRPMDPAQEVQAAFRSLGLVPNTKTIMNP